MQMSGSKVEHLKINGSVMVVGGGIAGIQSALDLAEMGYKVYMVEKSPAIGGTMPSLDKTFPTNDCSMCILSPKLVECGRHLNIEIFTNSEIVGVKGSPGNFRVRVRKEPRYIDIDKCTGCGECAEVCPVEISNDFEKGLANSKAIYKPYAQAYPNAYAIRKIGIAPCKANCPAGVNAQGYVALTRAGKFQEAAEIIYQDLLLPASLGRICPHPCESECSRAQKEGAISIAAIKRFLADSQPRSPLEVTDFKDDKVAIIGSGPAGLTCAFELLKKSYKATIFEALPVAGGMLAVGIPEYRLPREVLEKEINYLVSQGVEIKLNTRFGVDVTFEQLKKEGYKAVFLATGAHKNRKLGIPGEDAPQVFSGVDFLRRVNLGEKLQLGTKVAVVGGGDVAMDAARSALRLGAKEVTVYYRRSRQEVPARSEEIEAAEAEGVKFRYLIAPTRVIGGTGRRLKMECVEMELGEPDASGRRRPIPNEGSKLAEEVDTIIVAIGQEPTVECLPSGIKLTEWGSIDCDAVTLMTSLPGVFAGGEVRTGPGIAIEAIKEGKEAAESIIRYLEGRDLKTGRKHKPKVAPKPSIDRNLPRVERVALKELPLAERVTGFKEVNLGISPDEAQQEAGRCLDCGPCSECCQCKIVCKAKCIDHWQEEEYLEIDVGSVLLSPGFSEFPAEKITGYGYGKYANVVTSTQFERILSASGPFGGHLVRPSDHQEPKRIAWIQCVGSRNVQEGKDYCSSVCCMYAIKEAVIAKEHSGEDLDTTIFYMDMRSHGKDFEKYYEKAKKQGVEFIRSRIYAVTENKNKNLFIRYASENGSIKTGEFDLVVLSVGLCAPSSAEEIINAVGIEANKYGFARTKSMQPVHTSREGILAMGAFSGPKDIPETVTEASAAAIEAAQYLVEAKNSLIQTKKYPPEIDVRGQKPRIGVFVCHCGINIAGVVDVKAVVECAEKLENVVYVEDNTYTCSQDTQMKIKKIIEEERLNRVVVASCSPRTHEPLFRETLKEAGLNPFLFEMANIRDQCSWVHRNEPEAATEKARDLVRMAVAKARLLEPVETGSVPVTQKALVIGGGVSGMTAALGIASQGYPVFLIEKSNTLGGIANRLAFNHRGEPVSDFLQKLKARVLDEPLIKVYLNENIKEIKGFIGNFETVLERGETINHGVVVVATGAEEYQPKEFLYGTSNAVKTYLELEQILSTNPDAFKKLNNLVLINCVGSRNQERPYCSKVCCTQSVLLALKAKEINPDLNVFVHYRDMRTYGYAEELYLKARRKGVIFIRYDQDQQPEVVETKEGLQVKVQDHVLGDTLVISADLIGLAAAAVANPENEKLAKFLKVPLNEDGFFLEAHMKLRPVDFNTDGVFLCGLAHSPKPMVEALVQGKAAAARACSVLNKKAIMAGGLTAQVNTSICSGCGTCASICPAQAIEIDRNDNIAKVNETLCKGCGTCAASCRSHAIDVRGFRSCQIVAMLEEMDKVG